MRFKTQVLTGGLPESSCLAAFDSKETPTRSEEVVRNFQEVWDLVDVRVTAVATLSGLVDIVSQATRSGTARRTVRR